MRKQRRLRSTALLLAAAALAVGGCASRTSGTTASSSSSNSGSASGSSFLGSEDLDKLAQETVDTSKYKQTAPYAVQALTQGPINGWGLTWDVTMKYEAQQFSNIKSIKLVSSNGSASTQITSMESVILQKLNALALVPMSYESLVAPTARAMAAGIPVIVCANHLQGTDYTTLVTQDLYSSGFDAATAVANHLHGKGNVIMFSGIPGAYGAEIWKTAAEAAFKKFPGIKIVGNVYADWSTPEATTKAAALITAHPEIDGVYSGGGEMALGVMNAFQDAGRKQPYYGIDNPINGFLRVAEADNVQFDAYTNSPGQLAKACVDTVAKVMSGQPVKKVVLVPVTHYTNADIAANYVPQLNDAFVPPAVAPMAAYAAAGMSRN